MATRTQTYSQLSIQDFSGGWNPRDAWGELEDNELLDLINFSLDKKGSLVKRLGLERRNPAGQITTSGNAQILYYSAALDTVFAQIGANVYKSTDGGLSWTASIKTFTTNARIGMVDFLGKLILIHPVDRVFSYDGTTFTGPVANSPAGFAVSVWQNALWTIGDPAQPSRLTRSDLGAITWPGGPVTNDLRVKDDKPLTAIGGGEGMDEVGRAGFLVFKEDSTYRVHSLTDGAYSILDFNFGASGPLAITTNNGMTGAISKRGLIVMRGDASVPILASYKVEPLFQQTQMNFSQATNMCAGNLNDRMVFSLPWDGSSTNNLTLEYHPNLEWIVPHSFGVAAYTQYTKNARDLLGAKIGTGASDFGFIYDCFRGGADDDLPISCRAQTKWFEPNAGSPLRYRRCVVNGRGTFDIFVRRDYDSGAGERFPISIIGEGAVYGVDLYGTGIYGTTLQQDYREIFSLGVGRSVSFEISETSTATSTTTQFLDTGDTEIVGACALYGLNVDMVALGRS